MSNLQILPRMSDEMSDNVNTILDASYSSKFPNRNNTLKITKRPTYGYYNIQCKFLGTDIVSEKSFEFTPIQINKLYINQDFISTYMDGISLNMTLKPIDYINLYNCYKNLKCNLVIYPMSSTNSCKSYIPILNKTYSVIFKHKTDVLKETTKELYIPNNKESLTVEQASNLFRDVEVQLIEEKLDLTRKRRINLQARDITIRQAILLLCKLFEYKKISLIEPDNTNTYTNFVIPPALTFSECMHYLQDYYGVYSKGLGYYLTSDTIYVYPLWSTNSGSITVAHFYNIGAGNKVGLDAYHAFSKESVHIILNDIVHEVENQDIGASQIGTAFFLQRADRIIDKSYIVFDTDNVVKQRTANGELHINEHNTYLTTIEQDNVGISSDEFYSMFKFNWNNDLKYLSMLNSYRYVELNTTWTCAVPYLLKPGYRIEYHYDYDTNMRNVSESAGGIAAYATKKGTVASALYTFTCVKKEFKDYVFESKCDLTLFLDYDNVPVKKDDSETASNEISRESKEKNPELINKHVGIF